MRCFGGYTWYMPKPKNILFLITKSNWGGAQQYVHDLAINLPKERFEVLVAGGGNGALFAKLRSLGVQTISVRGLQRDVGILSEIRALRDIVWLIKTERPDVIHLNSSKAAGLGAVAAFLYKILSNVSLKPRPVPLIVFTIHGWGFKEDRPLPYRTAIFLASWLTCLFCDRIIVIDTADYESACRFLPRRKIVLIPNGLMEIDFHARAAARTFLASRIGHPLPDNSLVIGTIAELTKNKGLSYLIEAARTTPAFFVIIGEGEDRALLERQIADAGLADHVFLVGFVPDAARFLPGFDIFVLPSLKEGLPYALMAAMAAELPVVATQVGGIPDLVTDGEDGILVAPKDTKGLSAVLARLVADAEGRARLASRACVAIATKFPFSAMLARTISLYMR